MILFLISLFVIVVSYFCCAKWISFLTKKNYVDVPNHRSLHLQNTPSGGGVVIVLCVIIAVLTLALMTLRWQLLGCFVLLLSCWATMGWWDDRTPLSARLRLAIQMILSICSLLAYGYVDSIEFGETIVFQLGLIGAFVTCLGIIWFVNLYNFMDGLDGLAASQTIVAALTIAVWFWWYGDQTLSTLCVVIAASSYGFMMWNWHPAKLFLGDVGSLSIAACFAMLSLISITRYGYPVLPYILLFGVFIADATVTLILRLVDGEKIWQAHKRHYYQRLALLGISHTKIVMVYLFLMLLCAILASLALYNSHWIVTAIIIELCVFVLCAWYVRRISKQSAHKQ